MINYVKYTHDIGTLAIYIITILIYNHVNSDEY